MSVSAQHRTIDGCRFVSNDIQCSVPSSLLGRRTSYCPFLVHARKEMPVVTRSSSSGPGDVLSGPVTRSRSKQLGLEGGNYGANGLLTIGASPLASSTNGLGESPGVATPARTMLRPRRSESTSSAANSVPPDRRQGILRCICDGFLLSPHDQLLECIKCRNWLHALCVGFDTRVTPLTAKVRSAFVCPNCDPDKGSRKRKRDADLSPSKPQPIQQLREVPDATPSDAAYLDLLISRVEDWAKNKGFTIMTWPSEKPLSDKHIAQCMECCETSIADATFSDSYPRYCFSEMQQEIHKYLQMAAMHHNKSNKIVSTVLSNGMDIYGNIKMTVVGVKSAISRGVLTSDSVAAKTFVPIKDFSDFVHYTLVVTHDNFRGQSLAKVLMLYETLRWLRRGRTRAFVNMALTKRYEGETIVCSTSPASRALYHHFGFIDVHPKHEQGTGEVRYTKKEAAMGRLLATTDAQAAIADVARSVGISVSPGGRRKAS